jgi:H+/Cl- antiporter ClcA
MPAFYRNSKLLRRSRIFWGSFSLWRPRLVFWCGALAIGVISVAFAKLADLAQKAFGSLTSSGEWAFLLPLILTPTVFMLSAYLAATLFRIRRAAVFRKRLPRGICAKRKTGRGCCRSGSPSARSC